MLRLLLLLVAVATLVCAVSGAAPLPPRVPALSAAEVRSLLFPSLHQPQYQRIHSYASPIDLLQRKSSRGGPATAAAKRTAARSMTTEAYTVADAAATASTADGIVASSLSSPSSSAWDSVAGDNEEANAAASPSPYFAHTFPHRTFMLRVKVPLHAAARRALKAYLAPYELGPYIPHHAFLVTIGLGLGAQQGQEGATAAANESASGSGSGGGRGRIHPSFDLSPGSAHSAHPQRGLFETHPTSRMGHEEAQAWLLAAPGVTFVRLWSDAHKLHPTLAAKLAPETATTDSDDDKTAPMPRTDEEELAHWHFAARQFGVDPSASSRRRNQAVRFTKQMLHEHVAATARAKGTRVPKNAEAAVTQGEQEEEPAPARPFHMLHLRVHLHTHPLLQHSRREAVLASSSGSGSGSGDAIMLPSHRRRVLRAEEDALRHWKGVLDTWANMLASVPAPTPARTLDALWLQQHAPTSFDDHENTQNQATEPNSDNGNSSGNGSGSAPRFYFNVSTSLYDASSPTSYLSDTLGRVGRSPWHVHLTLVTPGLINVHASSWFVGSLVRGFLGSREEVLWVEALPVVSTPQNRFVAPIIQSDRLNDSSVFRRSWGRLRGQGQVVQLGDTGVDVDSCFFSDEDAGAEPIPLNRYSPSHRKFATYHTFENADLGDEALGHGTHVAGSLAGSVPRPSSASSSSGSLSAVTEQAYSALSGYAGMAPEARLAFYDFQRSGSEALLVPQSLYGPYLGHAYAHPIHARVSSNSWGSADGEYSSYCIEIDAFVADFPDSLVVFAAGNYGPLARRRHVGSNQRSRTKEWRCDWTSNDLSCVMVLNCSCSCTCACACVVCVATIQAKAVPTRSRVLGLRRM